MRHQPVEPFFLIIADRDAGVFTVEGPMTDDTEWVVAVCDAQQAGRRVNCSTAGPDRARAAAAYAQTLGLRLAPAGSIVVVDLP
jgi:hypothetical protein